MKNYKAGLREIVDNRNVLTDDSYIRMSCHGFKITGIKMFNKVHNRIENFTKGLEYIKKNTNKF